MIIKCRDNTIIVSTQPSLHPLLPVYNVVDVVVVVDVVGVDVGNGVGGVVGGGRAEQEVQQCRQWVSQCEQLSQYTSPSTLRHCSAASIQLYIINI